MPDELRPCPFCGGQAVYNDINNMDDPNHGGHFIQCTESRCAASSALIFASGDDPATLLRERWNRRAAVPLNEASVEVIARAMCSYDFEAGLFDKLPRNQAELSKYRRELDWQGNSTQTEYMDAARAVIAALTRDNDNEQH